MTTLSVALCTCDGARFLEAQLDSLLAQSRRPDELLVQDDASTDETPRLVEAFAARAPFPVRLERNAVRLGVAGNFARALQRCTGELIATCDQDDVWLPERLAQGERALTDPDVLLAFSDARLVDAELRPTGRTLWRSIGFSSTDQLRVARGDALGVLLGRLVVTGATMTLRASLLRAALPIGEGWIHDEWLSVMAALKGRLAPIAEPLVLYRQHGGNAVGAARADLPTLVGRGLRGGRAARVREQLGKWESLRARVGDAAAADRLSLLDARIDHLRTRAGLSTGLLTRAQAVAGEWRRGGYATGAHGGWSALQDLLG